MKIILKINGQNLSADLSGSEVFTDNAICAKSLLIESFEGDDFYATEIADIAHIFGRLEITKPECPECMMPTTQEELDMFGGLCEECSGAFED